MKRTLNSFGQPAAVVFGIQLFGLGGVGALFDAAYARSAGPHKQRLLELMDAILVHLRSIISAPEKRTRRARRAAEAIRDARGYRWIGLYDVASTEIVAIGLSGAVAPAFPRFSIDQGLNGAAVRSARPVVVRDVSGDPRYLTTFGSTGAEAIFPVLSSSTEEVIGTIDAESNRTNAFTPDDEVFLSACARTLVPLWLSPASQL